MHLSHVLTSQRKQHLWNSLPLERCEKYFCQQQRIVKINIVVNMRTLRTAERNYQPQERTCGPLWQNGHRATAQSPVGWHV